MNTTTFEIFSYHDAVVIPSYFRHLNIENNHNKKGKFTYDVTFSRVRATIVAVEKQCVIYSECVSVALVIQHAMLVSHTDTCGLSGSATFSTLSQKRCYFRKTLLNIKCVLRASLQHLREICFFLRRNEQDVMKNVDWSSCKVAFILVRI
jgi:hypothetical protein